MRHFDCTYAGGFDVPRQLQNFPLNLFRCYRQHSNLPFVGDDQRRLGFVCIVVPLQMGTDYLPLRRRKEDCVFSPVVPSSSAVALTSVDVFLTIAVAVPKSISGSSVEQRMQHQHSWYCRHHSFQRCYCGFVVGWYYGSYGHKYHARAVLQRTDVVVIMRENMRSDDILLLII